MATDYGTDFALLDDFPAAFETVSGPTNVGYAVARRWGTPRGSLLHDKDYGDDLRDEINDDSTPADLRRIEGRARAEAEKDPRVLAADVVAEYNYGLQRLELKTTLELEDGPFTFIVGISALTVDLIREGEAPVTVVAAAPVQPVTIEGTQGEPGPAGPPGAAGGQQERTIEFDSEYLVDGTAATFVDELMQNFAGLAATVEIDWSARVKTTAGTGTWRIYVGGTPGAVDGTLVATMTTTATSFETKQVTASFANPGGTVPIKLVAVGPGAGENTSHANGVIVLRPG